MNKIQSYILWLCFKIIIISIFQQYATAYPHRRDLKWLCLVSAFVFIWPTAMYLFPNNNFGRVARRRQWTMCICVYLSLSRESAKHYSFQLGFYSNSFRWRANSPFKSPIWRINVLLLLRTSNSSGLAYSARKALPVAMLLPV